MTSKEVKGIIEHLLRDPENQVCADCKTSTHPRWASWSLGVFICIKCAGFHRSLGTHISKVKSVDLDIWKEEHLAAVVQYGNNKAANNVYESGLGQGVYIPDQSKIGQFIKTKYELKKWYHKGDTPQNGSVELPAGTACSTPFKEHVLAAASQNGFNTIGNNNNSSNSGSSNLQAPISSAATQLAMPNATSNAPGNSFNSDGRPDLKKSILSLYSRPKHSSSSSTMPHTESVSPTPFECNSMHYSLPPERITEKNSSTLSLDDNELFKNVWI